MSKINSNKIFLFSILIYFSSSVFSQNKNPSKHFSVFVFFSENCPICQSYTLTLKNLHETYSKKNFLFIAVFPNYFSTKKGIDDFKSKYSIPFECIKDNDNRLTKHFNATITPEVFVEDDNQKLIYEGRIDDTFYALGKRRTLITSTDLENILKQLSAGNTITTTKTQAIGCIISSTK